MKEEIEKLRREVTDGNIKLKEDVLSYVDRRVGDRRHDRPSPETDKRLSLIENDIPEIKSDVKEGFSDIREAINRGTWALIGLLFTVLGSSGAMVYYIGTWKGQIDIRVSNLETRQEKSEEAIVKVRDSIRGIAKEEVDNFAKRNFESYNK